MEVSAQEISELRDKFFKKLEDEGPPDAKAFHPADISRIKESDAWLKRFLEHNELNMQESLSMLWKVCTWRRQLGINDITLDNVKREYLEEGAFFSHGKDKQGCKLFILKSKLHAKGTKDVAELQRCVIYWFERLEREGKGTPISIFFDMTGSGLTNVDMDFTQFLIGLFKNYYPNFLNYIIILDMPWFLNAAFKIIKSWLPAKAIPKIKFVDKTSLKQYVDPNDALECWGGNDDYTFTFVPDNEAQHDNSVNGKAEIKKVHFAEGSPSTEESPVGNNDQGNTEPLLSVEPWKIMFNTEGNETQATVILKNISSEKPVSYKIKTTSPTLFRVKPNIGMLLPNEQCKILIVLQSGHSVQELTDLDKFLILGFPLNSADTTQDLASLWKSQMPTEQHKLKCTSEINETQKLNSILTNATTGSDRMSNAFFSKMTCLEENYNKVHNELKILKYLVILSIMLTILIAIALAYVLKKDIRDYNDKQHCAAYHEL